MYTNACTVYVHTHTYAQKYTRIYTYTVHIYIQEEAVLDASSVALDFMRCSTISTGQHSFLWSPTRQTGTYGKIKSLVLLKHFLYFIYSRQCVKKKITHTQWHSFCIALCIF